MTEENTGAMPPRPRARLSWNDPGLRALVYQVVVVALVALTAWYLVSNTLHNLAARNISTGFAFLDREAGFAIGETPIDYTPADSYRRAIVVGLLNTLRVSLIALVLATVLGTLVGVARLSGNWLVSRLAAAYVECVRNVPLLLQLLLWYALISESMPGPRAAHHPLPGVYLSNRGLLMPALLGDSLAWMVGALAVAGAGTFLLARWSKRRQALTGHPMALAPWAAALFAGLPVLAWALSGAQLSMEVPHPSGFGFAGGWNLSPELFALLVGLVSYTAAFIAEIVRSGVQSVNRGQWEAAESLGLRRGRSLRLVVLPQALRVMVPPATSQYLNLVKHSSLAVAIGYPDLVSVVNTTLNQTGQAIEGILIIMAAFMTVSLCISLAMNAYNRRIALVER